MGKKTTQRLVSHLEELQNLLTDESEVELSHDVNKGPSVFIHDV